MNSSTPLKWHVFSSTKSTPKSLSWETLIPQKVPQARQLFRIIVSHVHNITFQGPHQLTCCVAYHHTCAMLFHLQFSRETCVSSFWMNIELSSRMAKANSTWFFQIWIVSCFQCDSSWRFVRLIKFGKEWKRTSRVSRWVNLRSVSATRSMYCLCRWRNCPCQKPMNRMQGYCMRMYEVHKASTICKLWSGSSRTMSGPRSLSKVPKFT